MKEAIYRNRVPKDQNKRGLFIHESLTEGKMELVRRCAKLRREEKVATYYTQGGNVYVKKGKGTPGLMVTPNMADTAHILTMLQTQPNTYREAARNTMESSRTGAIEQTRQEGPPQTIHDLPESKQNETPLGDDQTTQASGGAEVPADQLNSANKAKHSSKEKDTSSQERQTSDEQISLTSRATAGARPKDTALKSTTRMQNRSKSKDKGNKSDPTTQSNKVQSNRTQRDSNSSENTDRYNSATGGGEHEQTVKETLDAKATSQSPTQSRKSKRDRNRNKNKK